MTWYEVSNGHRPGVVAGKFPGARYRLTAEVLQLSAVLADLAVIVGSAVVSRTIYVDGLAEWRRTLDDTLGVGLLSAILFGGFLGLRSAYSAAHLSDLCRQVVVVMQGWAFTFFALAWLAFLFKTTATMSRGAVSIQFVAGFTILLLIHALGARWLAGRFARGAASLRRVAAVTVADEVGIERIRTHLARLGIEMVSLTAISPAHIGRAGFLPACREAVGNVRVSMAAVKLDGIYLFMPWRERRHIEELRSALMPMPVPVYLFADNEIEALMARPQVRVGDLTGFELQRAPLSRAERMEKRLFDIVVAGIGLAVLAPLMALVGLGIIAESGFPVFFRQRRKGFGAQPFEILKFRSMTVQENGPVVIQAARRDARVTRLGRILRRTSVDELPQLINVLRGDMSIVGPRPHAVAHDDHYDGLIAAYSLRQRVKPGITGWAQVNGHRGETHEIGQMSARVEHDLWYINNWSLWLDGKIVAKTAVKVLFDDQAF